MSEHLSCSLDGLSVRLPAARTGHMRSSDVSLSIASNEILCVVGEIRLRQVDDGQRHHAAAAQRGDDRAAAG